MLLSHLVNAPHQQFQSQPNLSHSHKRRNVQAKMRVHYFRVLKIDRDVRSATRTLLTSTSLTWQREGTVVAPDPASLILRMSKSASLTEIMLTSAPSGPKIRMGRSMMKCMRAARDCSAVVRLPLMVALSVKKQRVITS